MTAYFAQDSFVHELRRVLHHLHDPSELRRSPLLDLFAIRREANPPTALRHLLANAIEELRPGNETPPQSPAWRSYNILFYRFVEQLTQREVALDLGLSIRHLRRAETEAIRDLSALLWNRHQLAQSWPAHGHALPTEPSYVTSLTPDTEQELHWLQSVSGEPVAVEQLVGVAVQLVSSLAAASGTRVTVVLSPDLPALAVNAATARHALVSLLSVALATAPGGEITIAASALERGVRLSIRVFSGQPTKISESDRERLDMADRLVRLSGGVLSLRTGGGVFTATVVLPVAGQMLVLVIDDNSDTLRLIQRYLANTRYRFVGTTDPNQVLALAHETSPQIILLDVMLPGIDGWELLGRLHAHPRLHDVPIIVCTILPEENLASALGAAGFLRKPISRAALLAELDRQLGLPVTESH